MKRFVVVLAIAAMGACSNDDDVEKKQRECDAIAADIREKAVTVYGQPAQGACSNPALKPQFDQACASYQKCQQELADLKD